MKRSLAVQKTLIITTTVALIAALAVLGYYLMQYRAAAEVRDGLLKIAFENGEPDNNAPSPGGVNHAALIAFNPEYVGWLRVDGTDISYPVVYSEQDQYYLHRDFYRLKSVAGTIFMDVRNNHDFRDTNTMLFGHHMRNGSMFAPLKKFLDREFFETHRFVRVSTPERELLYEIYAVYETPASRVPYYPGVLGEPEWEDFSSRVEALARYTRELSVTREDRVLTLSTCGYAARSMRILLHAKLVDES